MTVFGLQLLLLCVAAPRWALNNVAAPRPPPCQPLLQLLRSDPTYLSRHAAPPDGTFNATAASAGGPYNNVSLGAAAEVRSSSAAGPACSLTR